MLDSTGPAQPSGDRLCTEASRLQIRDVRAAAVGRALIRRRHRRNAINIARQIRFSAAIGVGSRSLADDAACRLAAWPRRTEMDCPMHFVEFLVCHERRTPRLAA